MKGKKKSLVARKTRGGSRSYMQMYINLMKKKKGQVTEHRNSIWTQIIVSLEWKIIPLLA